MFDLGLPLPLPLSLSLCLCLCLRYTQPCSIDRTWLVDDQWDEIHPGEDDLLDEERRCNRVPVAVPAPYNN